MNIFTWIPLLFSYNQKAPIKNQSSYAPIIPFHIYYSRPNCILVTPTTSFDSSSSITTMSSTMTQETTSLNLIVSLTVISSSATSTSSPISMTTISMTTTQTTSIPNISNANTKKMCPPPFPSSINASHFTSLSQGVQYYSYLDLVCQCNLEDVKGDARLLLKNYKRDCLLANKQNISRLISSSKFANVNAQLYNATLNSAIKDIQNEKESCQNIFVDPKTTLDTTFVKEFKTLGLKLNSSLNGIDSSKNSKTMAIQTLSHWIRYLVLKARTVQSKSNVEAQKIKEAALVFSLFLYALNGKQSCQSWKQCFYDSCVDSSLPNYNALQGLR